MIQIRRFILYTFNQLNSRMFTLGYPYSIIPACLINCLAKRQPVKCRIFYLTSRTKEYGDLK